MSEKRAPLIYLIFLFIILCCSLLSFIYLSMFRISNGIYFSILYRYHKSHAPLTALFCFVFCDLISFDKMGDLLQRGISLFPPLSVPITNLLFTNNTSTLNETINRSHHVIPCPVCLLWVDFGTIT